MAEVDHALALLREEIFVADEVLGVLNKCQSGTKLDANGKEAIKQALLLLQGKELKLAKAGEALAQHQRLHLEVEGLKGEVRAGEQRVKECAKRLTRAEAVLSEPLKAAKRLLEEGRKAEEAEIDVEDVVDYAQRISGITSAPAYWKPGMAMVGFAPPAPRPEMMRAGALSAFSIAAGITTLSSDKLLKLATDLDKPPDTRPENGAAANGRSSDSNDDSTSTSQNGKRKKSGSDDESDEDAAGGSKRGSNANKGKGKGKADGVHAGNKSSSGGGGGSSNTFSRDPPPKRPKISLDISDDSDSDEDEEESD